MRTLIKARQHIIRSTLRRIRQHAQWAEQGIYQQAHLYINNHIA